MKVAKAEALVVLFSNIFSLLDHPLDSPPRTQRNSFCSCCFQARNRFYLNFCCLQCKYCVDNYILFKVDPSNDLDNKQLILSLKIKTIFQNQEDSYGKFTLIDRVYSHLIELPNFRTILGVIERKPNLRINFNEFRRCDVKKPESAQYLNKYSEKQIIIGVMSMFHERDFDFLCGKIAQKLCNYAMYDFFKNEGRPYFKGVQGEDMKKDFEDIVEECKDEDIKTR